MLETNNDIDFTTNNEIPMSEVIAQMEKEIYSSRCASEALYEDYQH